MQKPSPLLSMVTWVAPRSIPCRTLISLQGEGAAQCAAWLLSPLNYLMGRAR